MHSLDFETSNQQSWRWNTPIHEEYRWSWSSGNSAAKRLEGRQSHRHLGCHLKKMHLLKFNTSCFWSLRFSLCLTSLSVPRVCKSEVVQVTSKVTRIPTLYSSFGFLYRFLIVTFNLICFKASWLPGFGFALNQVTCIECIECVECVECLIAVQLACRTGSCTSQSVWVWLWGHGAQLGFLAATLKTSRNLIFYKKDWGHIVW